MNVIYGFVDFIIRSGQLIVAFAPFIFVVLFVAFLAELAIKHYLG